MVEGRPSGPTIFTSCLKTVSPGSVSSQLPPFSAARSTTTEPGLIFLIASSMISSGAGRPGTAAVEITASISPMASASSSLCFCCSESVSSRA